MQLCYPDFMAGAVNRSDWHPDLGSWEPLPLQLPVDEPDPVRRKRDEVEDDPERDRTGSYVIVIDLA